MQEIGSGDADVQAGTAVNEAGQTVLVDVKNYNVQGASASFDKVVQKRFAKQVETRLNENMEGSLDARKWKDNSTDQPIFHYELQGTYFHDAARVDALKNSLVKYCEDNLKRLAPKGIDCSSLISVSVNKTLAPPFTGKL